MKGRVTMVIFSVMFCCLNCSQTLQIKKLLEGEWEIVSIIEDGDQKLRKVTLNYMTIHQELGGFLPDKLDPENFDSKKSTFESYDVFKEGEDYYVFFRTTNDFFNDTFRLRDGN